MRPEGEGGEASCYKFCNRCCKLGSKKLKRGPIRSLSTNRGGKRVQYGVVNVNIPPNPTNRWGTSDDAGHGSLIRGRG
eukprot:2294093-Rhodomonas_salina.1